MLLAMFRLKRTPQDGYRLVVFGGFPGVNLLNRLRSTPTSGRFWHASLSWTLAVRFAGCDLGLRVSSKASDLLEELGSDGAHMIPQGSKWSTPAGQEAIRTFFWARAGCPLPSRQGEMWDKPPASPSGSTSSSSDAAASDRSDRDAQNSVPGHITSWFLFSPWWILLFICFARICIMN
jgi:hypothetical protein